MPDSCYELLRQYPVNIYPEANRWARLYTANRRGIACQTVIEEMLLPGYGLCSMAVVGLKASSVALVIPCIDDCIAVFLGSGQAY